MLVEGVFFILFLRLNPTKRGVSEWVKIGKTSMTKDIKVVKNLLNVSSSFQDIHANGHSSR